MSENNDVYKKIALSFANEDELSKLKNDYQLLYITNLANLKAKNDQITELQTALSVSEARLKKCVEQRDSEIIARWVGVWRARKVIDECNKQLEDLK